MKVELLNPDDARGVVVCWVASTQTALINPAADPHEIADALTTVLPDLQPETLLDAVLAALRAHDETSLLEALFAADEAPHPCETTADLGTPAELVAAASPGPRSADLLPCSSGRLHIEDTQPLGQVLDPGITADDVPPYPPSPPRRPRLPLAPLTLSLLLLAALLVGAPVPFSTRPEPGSPAEAERRVPGRVEIGAKTETAVGYEVGPLPTSSHPSPTTTAPSTPAPKASTRAKPTPMPAPPAESTTQPGATQPSTANPEPTAEPTTPEPTAAPTTPATTPEIPPVEPTPTDVEVSIDPLPVDDQPLDDPATSVP